MIQIQKASYKYKSSDWILKDIDITIQEGEFISIVGANGTGKSTLGKVLMGLVKVKKGKVLIDDLDVSKKGDFLELVKKIGIVFQNPENQLIFNRVQDEMEFGLRQIGETAVEEKITNALQQVGMKEFQKKSISGLSLGQKQRIAIAEILSRKPKYIILDEPTTMLDSQGKEDIYKIVKQLKKEGYTIIYITNVAEEILLADRTLILDKGRIAEEIAKEDLRKKIEVLKKYHIKVPFLVELQIELEKRNIQIDIDEITPKELVTQIWEANKDGQE